MEATLAPPSTLLHLHPRCRHSSRRCSPRCSSLLVSPIHPSEIRMQRNPPSTPEHPASRSVPSPQPPLVLGRLFFFVVSRHATFPLSALSLCIFYGNTHDTVLFSTLCCVRRTIDLLRLASYLLTLTTVKERTLCVGRSIQISVLTFH